MVGFYEPGSEYGRWLLNIGLVVYIVAGITDVLDGYLARKMNVVSAFGRIVDPFVDKVLTIGAFIMLTGTTYALNPAYASEYEMNLPRWMTGGMRSAVQTWMVVAILGREMVVSAVRGYSESCGVKFPATSAGKIKLFVQSVAICTVLFQLANVPMVPWAVCVKIITVWTAVVVTAVSGVAYIGRTRKLLRADE